jgi:hypothetical protein
MARAPENLKHIEKQRARHQQADFKAYGDEALALRQLLQVQKDSQALVEQLRLCRSINAEATKKKQSILDTLKACREALLKDARAVTELYQCMRLVGAEHAGEYDEAFRVFSLIFVHRHSSPAEGAPDKILSPALASQGPPPDVMRKWKKNDFLSKLHLQGDALLYALAKIAFEFRYRATQPISKIGDTDLLIGITEQLVQIYRGLSPDHLLYEILWIMDFWGVADVKDIATQTKVMRGVRSRKKRPT